VLYRKLYCLSLDEETGEVKTGHPAVSVKEFIRPAEYFIHKLCIGGDNQAIENKGV
jgi:hypothetical protein